MDYLKLPNFLLQFYVNKHFSEFSYEDFLNVVNRVRITSSMLRSNPDLLNDKNVLLAILDNDPKLFRIFSEELMDEEVINKLSSFYGVGFVLNDAFAFKYLLKIKEVRLDFVIKYPDRLEEIDSIYYDDELISVYLENCKDEISIDLFKKCPRLLNNFNLVSRVIKYDTDVIFLLEYIPDYIANKALDKGLSLTIEDFKKYPQLGRSMVLVRSVLSKYPDVIRYIDISLCNMFLLQEAIEYGFTITEEDLKTNQVFRNSGIIMEAAIKKNPEFIKYVGENAFIHSTYLDRALRGYQITLDDLIANPDITKHLGIMDRLTDFKLYSKYLDSDEKKSYMMEVLKSGKSLKDSKLPFLDYRFTTLPDVDKLDRLFNALYQGLDETDVHIQEDSYNQLLSIIDTVVDLRYLSDKMSHPYGDFARLSTYIMGVFENCKGNLEDIYNCALRLHNFVGKKLEVDYLYDRLLEYYEIFKVRKEVPNEITKDFYNNILNTYMNVMVSKENAFIRADLRYNLSLMDKKKDSILTGKKLEKLAVLISEGRLDEISLDKETLISGLKNVFNDINTNKDLRKKGITLSDDVINDYIGLVISKGKLTLTDIITYDMTSDKEVVSYIYKRVSKYLSSLSREVELDESEQRIIPLDKDKIELSYKDYKIYDNNRVISNIVDILLKLNEDEVDKILSNKECLDTLKTLVPYIDMFDEFKLSTFINMLLNYDRVRSRFKLTHKDLNINGSYMLRHLKDFMMLSNAYSSANNLATFGLGKNVCSIIRDYDVHVYHSFYLRMLESKTSYIPNVLFNNVNTSYSSGKVSDPDRLVIGKKPETGSCIDIGNGAGDDTYREVLTKKTGEVVLAKDMNGEIVNRIFLFRRGNVVQLVSSARSNSGFKVYQEIADQIMDQAIAYDDNIDYVIVNGDFREEETVGYEHLFTRELVNHFPHADFTPNGYVLSRRYDGEVKFKFDEEPKVEYPKRRGSINYSPLDDEITRLSALYISLLEDGKEKEDLSRSFEPFYSVGYDHVVCGDDWYITVKDDEVVEVILNTADEVSYEEIMEAKETLGIGKGMDL